VYGVTAELGLTETHQCLSHTVRLCARDASHERWNCDGNRTFTTDPAV